MRRNVVDLVQSNRSRILKVDSPVCRGFVFALLLIPDWPGSSQHEGLVWAQGRVPQKQVARATRVEQSPKLDGSLDEAAWRGAAVVSQFIQRDPREGEPASEKTEVRIVYNDRAIFFGIVCYDSESAKIIANACSSGDIRK